MRILLVRHGRPDGVDARSISGRAIGDWVRAYDAVGVSPALAPPSHLVDLAKGIDCFLTSDLRRARQSASWLAGTRDVIVDGDLREAVLPESLGISLPLPPGVWIVAARIAWFLDCGDACETVVMTRERAVRMADRLIALASARGSVMAVGHGMLNRFLARELGRRGWRGPRALPHGFWAVAEFHCENDASPQS